MCFDRAAAQQLYIIRFEILVQYVIPWSVLSALNLWTGDGWRSHFFDGALSSAATEVTVETVFACLYVSTVCSAACGFKGATRKFVFVVGMDCRRPWQVQAAVSNSALLLYAKANRVSYASWYVSGVCCCGLAHARPYVPFPTCLHQLDIYAYEWKLIVVFRSPFFSENLSCFFLEG